MKDGCETMKEFLDELCHDNPDGAKMTIIFTNGSGFSGVLRRARTKKGELREFYELAGAAPIQKGPDSKPEMALLSNFFFADVVQRVVVEIEQKIVTPERSRGGLIVGS